MAKLFGLNGIIVGRQGNNVFSVQNGQQVVKAYQPVVANPRTIAQREQRVKFALAGKVSAVTPSAAIVGMNGSSQRSRRGRFVSNLISHASVSGDLSSLTAAVPYGDVVYSEGSLAIYSGTPSVSAVMTGSGSARVVQVALGTSAKAANAPDGYDELAIVALYDADTSTLDEVQVQPRNWSGGMTFEFRIGEPRNTHVACYKVPFVVDGQFASPVSQNIADGEDAITLSALSGLRFSNARFGRSVCFLYQGVLAPSANMASLEDESRAAEFSADDNGDVVRAVVKKAAKK